MKKRKTWIIAAVFILICGGVCVWLRVRDSSGTIRFESGVGGVPAKKDTATEDTDSAKTNGTESGENAKAPEGMETLPNGTETPVARRLYVHMCGAVALEGVYELPAGSRLTDGIAAAGGFTEEADTSFHNLAACLQDGQKVYVPTKEEVKDLSVEERLTHGALPETDHSGEQGAGTEKKVNLNTADVSELMTLSGIGQSKAESIIQYRTKVGPFSETEELKNVTGIGDAMFERIKEYITVDG